MSEPVASVVRMLTYSANVPGQLGVEPEAIDAESPVEAAFTFFETRPRGDASHHVRLVSGSTVWRYELMGSPDEPMVECVTTYPLAEHKRMRR